MADYQVIVAGLRELINYFDTPVPATTPVSPAPAPTQKRGRGRPVAGESQPVADVAAPPAQAATPAAATTAANPAVTQTTVAATAAADPFAAPAPVLIKHSLDDVRAAYTALKDAVSQEAALKILKEVGGASNGPELKPEKYDAVVAAFKAAMPVVKPEPVVAADPFETAAPAKPITLEDIRAAIVQAQSRTATDTVQKTLMAHGGKGPMPSGGEGPSLKALPEANFAACLAAIQALPKTK